MVYLVGNVLEWGFFFHVSKFSLNYNSRNSLSTGRIRRLCPLPICAAPLLTSHCAKHCWTRNSPLDEIGERYRLNHAVVVKLYHPYQSPCNFRLSHRRIATFSAQWVSIVTFLLLRLINFLLTYLLTHLLICSLLITIYGSSME